ncbi:N-acetylgalactosaminyltransferase 4 [Stomoxys calcitrans]|uniref:N-acetylgalactosaminyltransferase 4 n=1 Tax=Stomoxys calcitrans TaxID=35570 RepID=UPI0027E25C01|nr:N-acetylgalactosaminyltransferase 4 [Stomoxys calcitrans]
MQPRYLKRLLKKVTLFAVTLIVLTVITIKVVERRISRQLPSDLSESALERSVSERGKDDSSERAHPPIFKEKETERTPRRPRPAVVNGRTYVKPILEGELDLTQFYDINVPFRLPEPKGPKRDWHDHAAIEMEMNRVGLGEHGMPSYITDQSKKELEHELSLENGFNALLSDSISVNRSVPDVRKEECLHREYLLHLPTTSVVIPFYNEYFSVLIRTIYSIKNRTPPELLHEIIIVDDFSDREYLKQQLDDYVANYFAGLVKIVRLAERTGLIGARLAGARRATGDVLVFFDSHIECNVNWLPPLLEPIAMNKRISTCPIVDGIDHATFAYNGGHQEGSRGAFDWNFIYKQMPVLPIDAEDKTQPYRNPIMMGGLFAIGREFFWELGGYDEGLDIWGAEQYELSFKIWMCGGMLVDVPCSRVAHVFRGPMSGRPSPRNYSFVARNHKRVAEVWMDEYKYYIYDRLPDTEAADPGDLSKQLAIREHLKCKSFKWYMEEIAPDLLKAYPPVLPPDYASGVIQSVAFPSFCVDTLGNGVNGGIGLFSCAPNKTHPQETQFWSLSYFKDIRKHRGDVCLDVSDSGENATIWMWSCHNQAGNQFWSYDQEHQMIVHGIYRASCLEAFVEGDTRAVYTNPCDKLNPRMRWTFGWLNQTAMDNFWSDVV